MNSAYTRAQAIRDRVLIDLSQIDSMRRGWIIPIACTGAVWSIIDQAAHGAGDDVSRICNDIATMAKFSFSQQPEVHRLYFKVFIMGIGYTFKLCLDSGDAREPVLTLMLAGEH